jgi:hypothetical protein
VCRVVVVDCSPRRRAWAGAVDRVTGSGFGVGDFFLFGVVVLLLGCGIFSTGGEVSPTTKGADMPTTLEQLADDLGTVIPIPPSEGGQFPSIYEFTGGAWEEHSHCIYDVYDLLNDYGRNHIARTQPLAQPDAFVLVTSGYAAPLENGEPVGAPSEHPQRRRVSLFVLTLANGGQLSRLVFHDTGEQVTEKNTYSGSLAECIDLAGAFLWGARFLRGLSDSALQDDEDDNSDEALRSRLGRLIRVRSFFDDEPSLRFEEN